MGKCTVFHTPPTHPLPLKISKQALGTSAFQDATMDTVLDLLLRFFANEATSVGFPELLVPVHVAIRGYLKECKNPKLHKSLKDALDKLEQNSKYVTSQRATLQATPREAAKIVSRSVGTL